MADERDLTFGEGLSSLNPAQKAAVCHVDGPCQVLAGPGSGKTFVLIRRLRYLISVPKIPPSNILTITFTRAAAGELSKRAADLLGDVSGELTFGTFHSVFYNILKHTYRFSSDNIIRITQKRELIKEIAESLKIALNDGVRSVDGLINEISFVKCHTLPEGFESAFLDREDFDEFFKRYRKRMADLKLIDFDDMMILSLNLFNEKPAVLHRWQDRFKYIQVDEFQDVDPVQYELLKLLSSESRNLFVVGDDDQSIYGFRGSDPRILLGFENDFQGTDKVLLSVNYRSTPEIVGAAGTVISENRIRNEKEIISGISESGEKPDIREFESREKEIEAFRELALSPGFSLNDAAILLRTNELAGFYTEKLSSYDIPFRGRDRVANIYEHFVAMDLLSYLSFCSGDDSRKTFYRIMNHPYRGISRNAVKGEKVDFKEILDYHALDIWTKGRITRLIHDLKLLSGMRPYVAIHYILSGMGYEKYLKELSVERHLNFEDLKGIASEIMERSKGYKVFETWKDDIDDYSLKLKNLNENPERIKEGVSIMTLHASKGLEFEEVFIFDVNETVIPYHKAKLEEEIEEERRLFYVGMTRAKKRLHLWHIKDNMGKGLEPSRFLRKLKDPSLRSG